MAPVKKPQQKTAAKAPPPKQQARPQPQQQHRPQPQKPIPQKQALAPRKSSEVAEYEEFENGATGLELVRARDLVIPRITILQDLSPQLKRTRAEYIEGAQLGDFCDTSVGDLFRGELEVLPCLFAPIYLEWAPRESGRGLVANHGTDASCLNNCTQDEKRRFVTPDGNYVQETATFYVLNLSAGNRRSFIPLSSTQMKAGRQWITKITNERIKRPDGSDFPAPIFYRCWVAKPVLTKNNQGEWHAWTFTPGETVLERDPSKELLAEAKAFRDQASQGIVTGDLGGFAEDEPSQGDPDTKPM